MSFVPTPKFVKRSGNTENNTGLIQCELCPHLCTLGPGKSGLCKVRVNNNGRGELPFYGCITALAKDPIEKKPLYHYRPGTQILSVGFQGCNLYCPFCQNWHISQNIDVPSRQLTPQQLIAAAQESGLSQIAKQPAIAYTYSEPLVHIEFLLDCMNEAKKQGVANVLVTNGCINSKAAEQILALTDAANIDLKCFSKETYSKVLGGNLETVLDFIRMAHNMGVHIEITTLIVPGLNDSEAELDRCIDFLASLNNNAGKDKFQIPWHLSAYHADWKWKAPATSPEFVIKTAQRARGRLPHVYTGNISGERNDTICSCGKILVSRNGYRVNTDGLKIKDEKGKVIAMCACCDNEAPFSV